LHLEEKKVAFRRNRNKRCIWRKRNKSDICQKKVSSMLE